MSLYRCCADELFGGKKDVEHFCPGPEEEPTKWLVIISYYDKDGLYRELVSECQSPGHVSGAIELNKADLRQAGATRLNHSVYQAKALYRSSVED